MLILIYGFVSFYSPDHLLAMYNLPNYISRWTIKDVQCFLHCLQLGSIADKLIPHNIDGIALLLLTSDVIFDRLSLSMGQAYKLEALLQQINGTFRVRRITEPTCDVLN